MFPFLVSFFAGISTLIGSLVIFINYKDQNKIVGVSLAFASGVMLTVSIIDLIPTSIDGLLRTYNLVPAILLSFVFIIIGILISNYINKHVPDYEKMKTGKLYKTGIFSMIAIILHNIPEGIATYLTTIQDTKLGITLAVAISLHNIPEGISIAIPLYFSTGNKCKTVLYTFMSGISEFFGAVIAFLFLSNIKNQIYLYFLFSTIAGIMLSLSIDELLPTTKKYISKMNILFYFILGCSFMLIGHFII